MNKEIMEKLFPREVDEVEKGNCPFCGVIIKLNDFKDRLSIQEYKISGLCQKCQDEMF